MRRREFITLLGGATAWPLAVAAQRRMPVVGLISGGSQDSGTRNVAAFRKGLSETGYVEGQNVLIEYHYLDGRYERVPVVVDELVRRRVAVIATRLRPGGARRQVRDHYDPDRLRGRGGPGAAWFGREPRPAGRQRDRVQFLHRGGRGKATWHPARADAESSAHRVPVQSRRRANGNVE